MSKELLAALNGNQSGAFSRWLSSCSVEPRIAWYPSAGDDLGDLLHLKAEEGRRRVLRRRRPLPPDIFLHTDYGFGCSSLLTQGEIRYGDDRFQVVSSEELPRCDLPLNEKIVSFPHGSELTGRVFFLEVEVNSPRVQSYVAPVLYVFAENAAFCAQRVLPLGGRFSHVIHIRFGASMGGGFSSGIWLLNVLQKVGCEMYITDEEEFGGKRDDVVYGAYPELRGAEGRSILTPTRIMPGHLWSNVRTVSWNLVEQSPEVGKPLLPPKVPRRSEVPSTEVILEARDYLMDGLLSRGFLVMKKGRGIELCPGSMEADVRLLGGLLSTRRLPKDTEVGIPLYFGDEVLGVVDASDPRRVDGLRRRAIRWAAQNRMTAPQGVCTPRELMWERFKACRFGAKAAVEGLERGVALLVKVLPWCGVRTTLSCEGHEKEDGYSPPTIWFYGCLHGLWCKTIFEHLFSEQEFSKRWRFAFDWDNDSWFGADWKAGADILASSEHRDSHDQLQIMARSLMLPGLSEKIRTAKAVASCPEDLRPSLELHVPLSEWAPKLGEIREAFRRQLPFRRRVNEEMKRMLQESMKTTEAVQEVIRSILRVAQQAGRNELTLRAGDLHDIVGLENRVPICCNAMRNEMGEADEVVDGPPRGFGPSLRVTYVLPRK